MNTHTLISQTCESSFVHSSPSQIDNRIKVVPRAASSNRKIARTALHDITVPYDPDTRRDTSGRKSLRERNHIKYRTSAVSIESPVLVCAHVHLNVSWRLHQSPSKYGINGVLRTRDLDIRLPRTGRRGRMDSVPVDDLILVDDWFRTILPPGNVVLCHDSPRVVIEVFHIVLHAV